MTDDIDVVPEAVSPSEDIELTIRQAYQSESDLKFTCPLSWTIKQVKEHVKNCLTSHPDILNQRLIFSGASLNNEQILSDVLRERNHITGAQIFFHLMITQPYQPASPESDVRRRNVNGNEATQNTASSTNINSMMYPGYAQNMVAWQQYWAAYNQLSPEQQTSEHQRLMVHYYSYAMANPATQMNQITVNTAEQNAAAWRARLHGVDAAAVANGNQAAAPPRQGRVDLLEVGYRIFKLVLLFSAILLYSSFERFALVLCSALFIYFIQLRRNHARNRAQAAAAAAAQPANNQEPHVNNNNNGENEEENTAPGAEGETLPASDAPQAPPVPQPTTMQVFIATTYSFITSFFASLVPDHPMPMDLN